MAMPSLPSLAAFAITYCFPSAISHFSVSLSLPITPKETLQAKRYLALQTMDATVSPSSLEKGESASQLVDNPSRIPTSSSESDANSDPASTAEQVGFPGLANLMASDTQYNIHHFFEIEAVEVLLNAQWNIHRTSAKIREIQRHRASKPQAANSRLTKWERKLSKKLRRELSAYYGFLVKFSTVVRLSEPHKEGLEGIKNWSDENFPAWHDRFSDIVTDDLRSLWPRKGEIERFITTLPNKKLGRVLCRPLLNNKHAAGDVQLHEFSLTALVRLSTAAVLFLLAVFFQIPVSLLSYRVLDRGVAIGVALGFCFLFSLFAQWLAPDRPEVLLLLVFAYDAIIGGNIINLGAEPVTVRFTSEAETNGQQDANNNKEITYLGGDYGA
ncbi:hypothetical protein B0T22DRAFT_537259 [Podospora appendiculata]|uniref:DUF6594 domain-containing protein n=1 Tax=Podospora appendiculata TaxID=314037 RepID=A0AAE0X4I3_9PEZI|nr:hypothetical protein B0T22DRAFT_537259 [Podospora appendiculata]